jgi:hypothetical protein
MIYMFYMIYNIYEGGSIMNLFDDNETRFSMNGTLDLDSNQTIPLSPDGVYPVPNDYDLSSVPDGTYGMPDSDTDYER